jgi:hypothetical protein
VDARADRGLLWWTRRFVPGALGSGIPQVVRALDDDLQPAAQRLAGVAEAVAAQDRLVSAACWPACRSAAKGPTVQVGAGVMVQARRWLSPQLGHRRPRPDGGRRRGRHRRGLQHAAGRHRVRARAAVAPARHVAQRAGHRGIVLAGLVAVAVFGNETYFGRLRVQELSWSLLGRACWWRWWRAWPAGCSRA